jgi:uncharacterized protein YecE (DUF72 family)
MGTSGWSYEHWKGPFYPRRLRSRDMLGEYAKSFGTAEINSSFYRLPAVATLKSWYEATPPGFILAAKASRYITHMKKLNDPGTSTAPFFARMRALGDKLGPILFQLPPHWGFNESRLAAFLEALDHDLRYAFEFRDRSWLNDRALELLAEHDAARIFDLEGCRKDHERPRLSACTVLGRYRGSKRAPCSWGIVCPWSRSTHLLLLRQR